MQRKRKIEVETIVNTPGEVKTEVVLDSLAYMLA